ncbi:DUF4118 domain-containing protein [Tautonia rosea]|uniref:DUF4118 domain-containing protein n=1 Tax=Tautonia rosea TaxID=2728037 RepID=UPI001474C62F|nr:DUF4118 domain-containing protein [Tautonia rosea]
MLRQPLPRTWGYGIAVLAVLVASMVRLAMEGVFGPHHGFGTFLLAVVVVSWLGGGGPAILTLVLGVVVELCVVLVPRASREMGQASD